VSGLVLALFVASVAVGIMTTMNHYERVPTGGIAARDTLLTRFTLFIDGGRRTAPVMQTTTDVPASLVTELQALPGVRGVTLVHADPADADRHDPYFGLVNCADLARTPALGHCPAGATTARIAVALDNRGLGDRKRLEVVPASDVRRLPVQTLVLDAQGSRAAVERARTLIEQAFGQRFYPTTIAEENAQQPNTRRLEQYQQLAEAVMLASLAIAGCSLAVSVAAGLSERKRPFSLLRLSGAPLGVLRRVVALESAVPLIGLAAVSIAVGFLSAGLFVDSQLSETLQAPAGGYYVTVLVGLVTALVIITCTLPLLERITGPEAARND
jgi:hypothetical protein